MTKKITLITFLSVIILFAIDFTAYTFSSQPPPARSGAPNEQTCGLSGCHDTSPVNSGLGSVTIELPNNETEYEAGKEYIVKVSVDDVTMSRFGFELTALDSAHKPAGTFIITNSANTSFLSANVQGASRKYVAHKDANSNNAWEFKWKSPATTVGKVTFYGVGNAANGAGDSGDLIYTNSLSFNQKAAVIDTTAGIAQNTLANFSVYPNPATDYIVIENNNVISVAIYTLQGQLVVSQNIFDSNRVTIDDSFETGLYYVVARNNKGEQGVQKLLIVKK